MRLRGGEADIPRFRQELARLTGRSDIDIWDLPAQYADGQRQVAFESRCLLALAGAAFLAALLLLGQFLARYAADIAGDLRTLRAVGLTTWQALLCGAAGPAVAGTAGAVAAAGGAIVASRWFPIGIAALLEPSPGISTDWVVLGPALVIVPVLVTGGALLIVRAALRATAAGTAIRRLALAAAAVRAGLATPVLIGIRFALESGRGRTAVPVRPALAGAVIGVLGIVGAFTFARGVTDSVAHPERWGQTYQLVAETGRNGEDWSPTATLTAALGRLPDVTGVDDSRVAVATAAGGRDSVTLYEYAAGAKSVPVVVLSGSLPQTADQVLLAPRTLDALHARVGGRVRLTGSTGTGRDLTVSGSGLVPEGSHNSYADGGWVTSAGYQSLFRGFKYHLVLVTLAPPAQTADAPAVLAAQLAHTRPELASTEFDPADPPEEAADLLQVQELPVVLGLFLAVLALGAVGHALVTGARRRAADIAILRTLGLTRWDCRVIFVTQSAVLAAVGLVAGIPAGLATGRLLWHAVADYTPVQYVPPLDVSVVLVTIAAAIALAGLLAALPGHRAARLPVARILRTE